MKNENAQNELKQSEHSRDELRSTSLTCRMQEELVRSKSQNAKYIEEINNKEILLRREYAEKREIEDNQYAEGSVSRLEVVVRDNENETRRKLDAERKKNEKNSQFADRVKVIDGKTIRLRC